MANHGRKYADIGAYLSMPVNTQKLIASNAAGLSALEGVLPDLENRFHSVNPVAGMHDFNDPAVIRQIGKEVQRVMKNTIYPNNVKNVPITNGKSIFFKTAMSYKGSSLSTIVGGIDPSTPYSGVAITKPSSSLSTLFRGVDPLNAKNLMDELCELMGLHHKLMPLVEIDKKSAPRRLIGQLVRQKFIPSYNDTPDDLKWLVKGEGDCRIDESIHILDLLGVYESGTQKVILYDLLIKLCSIKLNIDYDGLRMVVLLHELSHKLTHLGLDENNQIWDCFAIAPKDKIEYFAQIYTYKRLMKDNNNSLMDIMNTLSEIQPNVYQTYKLSINQPIDKINNELLEARRMIPNGYEQYPEAMRANWKIEFDNLVNEKKEIPQTILYFLTCDMPTPPKEYETIQKGTTVVITANKIYVRSYDYSPSDDFLPGKATNDIYKIIIEQARDIKQSSIIRKSNKPYFRITFGNEVFELDLADTCILSIWESIVDIISETYPNLARVLRGYNKIL